MAPKTLLPLPSQQQRIGGWSVDVGFIKAIQSATQSIMNGDDETPSLEQIEHVLLAANAHFLRCWITAGGEIPNGGVVDNIQLLQSKLDAGCEIVLQDDCYILFRDDGNSVCSGLTLFDMINTISGN